MPRINPLDIIQQNQKTWANAKSITLSPHNEDYVAELKDNLFLSGLNPETRNEFENKGGGNELKGALPKMNALYSSSALACNFFDYWRKLGRSPIAIALQIPEEISEVKFEQTFDTGLRRNPPHLDVVFLGPAGLTTAIESKFTECYKKPKNEFACSYFEPPDIWKKLGLFKCRSLAYEIFKSRKTRNFLPIYTLPSCSNTYLAYQTNNTKKVSFDSSISGTK